MMKTWVRIVVPTYQLRTIRDMSYVTPSRTPVGHVTNHSSVWVWAKHFLDETDRGQCVRTLSDQRDASLLGAVKEAGAGLVSGWGCYNEHQPRARCMWPCRKEATTTG